jgi:hypothetical protein
MQSKQVQHKITAWSHENTYIKKHDLQHTRIKEDVGKLFLLGKDFVLPVSVQRAVLSLLNHWSFIHIMHYRLFYGCTNQLK